MDSADTRASEEGEKGLWNHGQVQSNSVTLLHAHLLEDVGELRNLSQQLAVCDGATLANLVGFIDDGRLVRVL